MTQEFQWNIYFQNKWLRLFIDNSDVIVVMYTGTRLCMGFVEDLGDHIIFYNF